MNLRTVAAGRSLALLAFLGVAVVIMAFFYSGTGSRRPIIDSGEYTATVEMKDVDNLVKAGQVQVAGVRVGQVRSVEQGDDGRARVELALNDDYGPLHEGAKLRVAERSLVGETYLALTDGSGKELPSGTELPATSVQRGVQLHDVLASVDKETRGELRSLLRSLGAGTAGTKDDTAALMSGLGKLGREGHTALDAIAAQSSDLKALARQTTQVLQALDTGQGQITSLVRNANRLTAATSGQRQAVEDTLRIAPGLLDTATNASGSLESLGNALLPVASDLKSAGPALSTALMELPATTTDLRGMLPDLSSVLDKSPSTLKKVPTVSKDLQGLIPTAQATLADVNPMLAYIKPYGPELAAYFANFNAVLNYRDENGAYYLRLTPLVNTHSAQLPIKTDGLLGNYTNPYPAPGSGAQPGPFKGDYPRVERDGQ